MTIIELKYGFVTQIDDDDIDRLIGFSWNVQAKGNTFYVRRTDHRNRRTIYMHREVLQAPPDRFVDHIDGDGLNNRSKNLRLVTHRQNMWNRQHSNFMGVCWLPKLKKWRARVIIEGRAVDVGRFATSEEALIARDILCAVVRGEFATLNKTSMVEIDRLTLSPTARRILFQRAPCG